MVKLFRPDEQTVLSSARISPATAGTAGAGQVALGAAIARGGQQLQRTNIQGLANQFASIVTREGERQMRDAMEGIQTSQLQDSLTDLNNQYNQALNSRQSRLTDEKGTPLYPSLVDDTKKIGEELLNKQISKVTDPIVRKKIADSFQQTINNKLLATLPIARKQQFDHSKDSYDKFRSVKLKEAKLATDDTFEDPLREIEDALNQRVLAGEITEDQRTKELADVTRDVNLFRFNREIKTNPTSALSKLSQSNAFDLGISDEDYEDLFIKAEKQSETQLKADAAQFKILTKKINTGLRHAEKFLQKGQPILPELSSFLIDASKGTIHEDTVNKLIKRQSRVLGFSNLSTDSRQKVVDFLNTKRGDPRFEDSRKEFTALNNSINSQLEKDPVSFAINKGLVPNKPALDVTQDIPSQLAERADVISMVSTELGVPTHGLTESEVQNLTNHLNTLGSNDQLEEIQNIQNSLEPDAAAKLFGDMRTKKNGMLSFAAMMVSQEDSLTAYDILEGRKLSKNKEIVSPNKKIFFEALSGLDIPGYFNAEQKTDVLEAARMVYNKRAFDAGALDPNIIDQDLLAESLYSVTNGEPIEYGNFVIEAPLPDMDEDDFEDWIESLTEEELRSLGDIDEATRPLREIIRDADLQNIGRGQYIVRPTDIDDPSVAVTTDGGLYILDYNVIENNRGTVASGLSAIEEEAESFNFLDFLGFSIDD